MRDNWIVRGDFIKNRPDCLNYIDITFLILAADVVVLPRASTSQHGAYCLAVVGDIYPVPNVLAITVNRQLLSLARIQNHQGNQLLGKLKRAIVVGAIRR